MNIILYISFLILVLVILFLIITISTKKTYSNKLLNVLFTSIVIALCCIGYYI